MKPEIRTFVTEKGDLITGFTFNVKNEKFVALATFNQYVCCRIDYEGEDFANDKMSFLLWIEKPDKQRTGIAGVIKKRKDEKHISPTC